MKSLIASVCVSDGNFSVTYKSGEVRLYKKPPRSVEYFIITAPRKEEWVGKYKDEEWKFTIYRGYGEPNRTKGAN